MFFNRAWRFIAFLQEGKGNNPSHQWAVDKTWLIFSLRPYDLQSQRQPQGTESRRDRNGRDAAEAPDGAEGGVARLLQRRRRLSRRGRGDEGVVPGQEPLQLLLQGEAQLQGLQIDHAPSMLLPSAMKSLRVALRRGALFEGEFLQVQGGLDSHDGPDRPVGEVEGLGQFDLLDLGAAFAQRLDVLLKLRSASSSA